MQKMKQKYVCKALFFCKLALAVLLLFMMTRMFVILGGSNVIFTPSSVSASEDIDEVLETRPSQNTQDYTAIISNNIFGISALDAGRMEIEPQLVEIAHFFRS